MSRPGVVDLVPQRHFRFTDSQPNVTFIPARSTELAFVAAAPQRVMADCRTDAMCFSCRREPRWAPCSGPVCVDGRLRGTELAVSSRPTTRPMAARAGAGCAPNGAGLCGTVTAPAGLKSVIVWIQQKGSEKYYNGRGYASKRRSGTTPPSAPNRPTASVWSAQPGSTAWTCRNRWHVHGAGSRHRSDRISIGARPRRR